jgi:hypothetical protein
MAGASTASAYYVFKDAAGGATLPGGTYGANVNLNNLGTIDLTVPTQQGNVTNHCSRADAGLQIYSNDPNVNPLLAYIRNTVFSSCDLAQIYTTGRITMTISQNQVSTAHKVAVINVVQVLARNLGGNPGLNCEYHGQLQVDFRPGNPSIAVLGYKGINKPGLDTLQLYGTAQPGSFTVSDSLCPPFGKVAGTLQVEAVGGTTTNNIIIEAP